MNSKLLSLTSFFIALFCHLFIFSLFTFVFPIDPAAFKPKFFFLGPMLKQSDMRQVLPKKRALQSNMTSGGSSFGSAEKNLGGLPYETADQTKNPFAIRAIEKPLTQQTVKPKEKIVLKSTFEAPPETEDDEIVETKSPDTDLKIQPYRSLRFRSP